MNSPLVSFPPNENQLTDILGLRACGIFPTGKEPSVRTLREWTKLRRIPHHRVWHFDVGNVINTGWPRHWIEVLGPRIAAVHVKEYSRKLRDEKGPYAGFDVELTTGDSDWPSVMAALDAVNYSGWLIAEQYRPPEISDAAWLKNLTTRMDQILAS